jgi:lipoate-protein ligase A
MKIAKCLVTAALFASLTTASGAAFTIPDSVHLSTTTQSQQIINTERRQEDPIKALENKKEQIQSRLKEGKITTEKADAITARIDTKIREIQEFNKLSVPQKKDKLIREFKARMDKKVSEGRLTQDKADELIKNYTEKVNQWDGQGYPKFGKKGCFGKKHKNN